MKPEQINNDVLDEFLKQQALLDKDGFTSDTIDKEAEQVFSGESKYQASGARKDELINKLRKETGFTPSSNWFGLNKGWIISASVITVSTIAILSYVNRSSDHLANENSPHRILPIQEIAPERYITEAPKKQEIIVIEADNDRPPALENEGDKNLTPTPVAENFDQDEFFENQVIDSSSYTASTGPIEHSTEDNHKDWTSEYVALTGKIFNSKTRAAIKFADLRVRGKLVKSISRSDGTFDFRIPTDYYGDTLEVSATGYEKRLIPISNINNIARIIIPLNVINQDLVDKQSGTDGENVYSILQEAVTTFRSNFKIPVEINGFYRELLTEDGKHTRLMEAELDVYKGPVLEINEISISEARNSTDRSKFDPGFGSSMISTFNTSFLYLNMVLGGSSSTQTFDFKSEGTLDYLGETVHILSFLAGPGRYSGLTGYMYISKEDKTILLFKTTSGKDNNYDIKFKSGGGKILLRSIKAQTRTRHISGNSSSILYENTCEFQTVEVSYKNPKPNKNIDPINDPGITTWARVETANYNASFWKNYMPAKNAPLGQKVIYNLEKGLTSLEEQFKQ